MKRALSHVALAASLIGRRGAPRLERVRLVQGAQAHRQDRRVGLRASARPRAAGDAGQDLERGARAAVAHGEPRPGEGMLKPGATVTVEGYPNRDKPEEMRAERIIVNGKTVELR